MRGAGWAAAFAGAARRVSRPLTLLFVRLAWTLFRAPDMQAALRCTPASSGFRDWRWRHAARPGCSPGDAAAAVVELFTSPAAAFRPHWETRHAGNRLAAVIALWPIPAFLLSFALIAEPGAVPFLYFQFLK